MSHCETLGSILTYVEKELEPVCLLNSGTPARSLEDAVRDYNNEVGVIRTFDVKKEDEKVDLNPELVHGEEIRTVIDVIPDFQFLQAKFGDRTETQILLSQLISSTPEGTSIIGPDPNNQITNWIQQADLYNQLKSFIGIEPQWREEDNVVFLDHFFDSGRVFVVATVNIPANIQDNLNYEICDPDAIRSIQNLAVGRLMIREARLRALGGQVGFDADASALRKEGEDLYNKEIERLRNSRELIL